VFAQGDPNFSDFADRGELTQRVDENRRARKFGELFRRLFFFDFASIALGMGAMRVPRPAAGMMATTFIAGCKYTGVSVASSNVERRVVVLQFGR